MTSCREQEGSFLVLNKRSAWERGLSVNLQTSDAGLQIREEYVYAQAEEMSLAALTGALGVSDFAVGECNLLYVLGTTRTDFEDGSGARFVHSLSVYDANQHTVERLDCLDALFTHDASAEEALAHGATIAYAPGTLYVADTAGEERIRALADFNWQVRWTVGASPEPADESPRLEKPFEPVGLATDGLGNLYALDRSNLAILRFDPAGRMTANFGRDQLRGRDAAALAISRDGFIYVLDRAGLRVLKFHARAGGGLADASLIDFRGLIDDGTLPADFVPTDLAVDTRGDIYVSHTQEREPALRDDNSFVRRFSPAGEYLGVIAAHRGSGDRITIDEENAVYLFSGDEAKFVRIAPERKFQRLEGTTVVGGSFFSQSLDSITPGTEWHKFLLDAAAPANTQIQVSYLIGDEKLFNLGAGPPRDLDAYLAEVSEAVRKRPDETLEAAQRRRDEVLDTLRGLDWSVPVVNANDALLRTGEGRFLWLRIELFGSEAESPVVRSVRLDFPRTSYLRYLPAVYQEDDRSRDFLERFLSVFETFFAGLENQIGHLARYFDADSDTTSGEYLRWLASWLGVSADKSWDEPRLRALVKAAPRLFRKRGTREGLEEMIEIFTGERPLVVEHFQVRSMLPAPADADVSPHPETDAKPNTIWNANTAATPLTQAADTRGVALRWREAAPDASDQQAEEQALAERKALEAMYARLYGTDPYCFCVMLKPFQVRTEEERRAVRRILDAEKPAHTCAGLLVLQPWVQLDMHTYMGVNTYLSQPSGRLDSGATIPRDTVLDDTAEAGQIGRQSRLSLDITLT